MIKMLSGITLTGIWLGAAVWYSWHQFGFDRFLSLPPAELGQFVVGLFFPVAIIWTVVLLWPGRSLPRRSLDDALAARIEALNLSLDLTQDKLGQTTKFLTGPMEAWHTSVLQAIEKSLSQHAGLASHSDEFAGQADEVTPSSSNIGQDQAAKAITQVLQEEIASLQQATRNAENVVARAADLVNEPIEALSRETNKALKEQFASLCKAIRLAQETQLATSAQNDSADQEVASRSESEMESSTADETDNAEGSTIAASTTVPATIQAMLAKAMTEETENHTDGEGGREPEATADDVGVSEAASRAREAEINHRHAIDRLRWLRRVRPSGEAREAEVSPAFAEGKEAPAYHTVIDEPPNRLVEIGAAVMASLGENEAMEAGQRLLSAGDSEAFFELLGSILSRCAEHGPVDRLGGSDLSALLKEYCGIAEEFADAVRHQGASPEALRDMEKASFMGVASLIRTIRDEDGRSPALRPGTEPNSAAATPPASG